MGLELIFTQIALLAIILVASLIFFKRIKAAQSEYENAKEFVHNITSGFSRQVAKLRQEVDQSKIEAGTAKIIASEALKLGVDSKDSIIKSSESIQNIQNQAEIDRTSVKNLENRLDNTEITIDSLKKEMQKISVIKSRTNIPQQIPAAIPVQQENIIYKLTDTEINILKRIADLKEGTVPEIKEHLGLTREHTARMLKKLYESGYVDRSTNAMPYRYSVRKEIRDMILQRSENPKIIEK
ncbi:MarR family transcriptional regulator [Candidatus Bathyarchaeota archaeon]|nr:MarR family transcriptional regulator [Candidatus Bathyarchaeota archaeon]